MFERALTIRRSFSTAMTGVALVIKKIGIPFNVRLAGATSIVKKVGIVFTAELSGAVSVIKKVTKPFSTTMTGVASLARALTIRRTLEATAVGRATSFIKLAFDKVPGGAAILVKRFIHIFDD